jgi:hypothetical protein
MNLRAKVRQLRLYFKSGALFRAHLAAPSIAWRLPFMPPNARIEVAMASGQTIRMLGRHWPLLPSACRLTSIGAKFEFLDDAKRIEVDGLTLYSPLWSREEASYYREVLIDDSYEIKDRDLTGRMVVDVGAYVGDSTIAFARRGAFVHAFEPSISYCGFIRRNLAANGFESSVVLHEVGLAEREEEIVSRNDRLRLVEGVEYALKHLPPNIDILKLDCEGAEYHLLADRRFLAHLRPTEIRMEYHRGVGAIASLLREAGYAPEFAADNRPVGLLFALLNDL